MASLLALIAFSQAQISSAEGVERDFVAGAEGVVLDVEAIAAEFRVDGVIEPVEADVGEVFVDGALFMAVKEAQHRVEIDRPHEAGTGMVTVVRRLVGLAVRLRVIGCLEPGRQGSVEVVEREQIGGENLRFELPLDRAEEAFDQSAGRWVARRPVQELDVQFRAGQRQGLGMVDLGVVDVQLAAGTVLAPRAEQRIDQDVEVLADVIACSDDVAAVAVDPSREMGLDHLAVVNDTRPVLEIADP